MRWTEYLVRSNLDNDRIVLFSTLSGSVVVLDSKLIQAIGNKKFPMETRLVNDLKKTGFLVEETFGEKEWATERFLHKFKNPGTLDIVVAPSMTCNFGCPYCYERRDNQKPMSESTFQNLLQFIEKRAQTLKVKKITMSCYGGEPLLYPEYFVRIKKFIDNKFPELKQFWGIITNGSLINERLEYLHSEIGLDRAQVTLHGSEEFHNKERPYSDGSASYQEVVNGIKKAVNLGIKNIEIRVNVDKENANSMEKLLSDLTRQGLANKKNLRVYPYPITKMTENSAKYEVACIQQHDYFDKLRDWTKMITEKGFGGSNIKNYFRYLIAPMLCGSYSRGFYAIGPRGEINPCWEHINETKFFVGNVNNNPTIDPEKEKWWLEGGRNKILDCAKKDCVLLPICGGGCAAQAIHETGDISGRSCFRMVEDTKRFLKLYAEYAENTGNVREVDYSR